MKIETIILLFGILSTGIMAGIFFTWTNAVTPGIGKLSNIGYLQALQSMNRVILNISFRITFMGAVIAVALIPMFYFKNIAQIQFWVFAAIFIVYWIGVFGITFLGNIPLNRMLDNANLETISKEDAKFLRRSIEAKWNNLNLVRTISSGVSFLLLIISLAFINK